MVSKCRIVGLVGCLSLACGGSALAQTQETQETQVDWRAAGGDLFGRSPAPASIPAVDWDGAPRLPDLDQPYAAMIDEAAALHALDPKLLHAVVIVGSVPHHWGRLALLGSM